MKQTDKGVVSEEDREDEEKYENESEIEEKGFNYE